MRTNPLRILALVVAVSAYGVEATRGQQFTSAFSGPPASSMPQMGAPGAYGGPMMAPPGYGQPMMGPPPGYGAPPPGYGGGPMMGPSAQPASYGGYPGGTSATPYYEQTPPNAYWNQPVASTYHDPYQPGPQGEMNYSGGDPMGECPPLKPHIFAYTRGEFFFLRRGIVEGINFASDGVGGPIVLSTDDLQFEHEPGIRAVAGIPLYDYLTVEATYFGLQDWVSSANATDPASLPLGGPMFSVYSDFGQSGGFSFSDGTLLQKIDYQSELHSAELNFLHKYYLKNHPKLEAVMTAGARYVKVQEGFDYFTQGAPDSSITRIKTDNDLVGFQFGGILNLQATKKLRITTDGKLGAMVNMAGQRTAIGAIIVNNPVLLTAEEVEDEVIAFLAEAGAGLIYDLTPWCSITAGYRVFHVDGLALGPQNFNPVLPQPFDLRVPALDDDGTLLYHGMNAGFEIRW